MSFCREGQTRTTTLAHAHMKKTSTEPFDVVTFTSRSVHDAFRKVVGSLSAHVSVSPGYLHCLVLTDVEDESFTKYGRTCKRQEWFWEHCKRKFNASNFMTKGVEVRSLTCPKRASPDAQGVERPGALGDLAAVAAARNCAKRAETGSVPGSADHHVSCVHE